jgi:phage terminase large subunit
MFQATTAVNKIIELKKRIRIIQGGTSAGKTIAMLLILIDRAQIEKGKTFSVVSETVPHLKRGAIKDFLAIMQQHNFYKDSKWNRTDFIYKFDTGSTIEFFSADTPDKVRGPRRDVLFINEANNITYDTFTQLEIRTNEDIYLDFNPVQEFWVHTEIMQSEVQDKYMQGDNWEFIIINYKDNEALPDTIKDSILAKRGNKYFWSVYGLGEMGEIEGKIYKGWMLVDDIPFEARLVRYGLDFGYSNDPTALIGIYEYNGGYILDEKIYRKGLSNKQIADTLGNLDPALVIADSAEPKSIDEIRLYGVNIIASVKGKDSVNTGIQLVQDKRISMTKRSTNLIKEYRNYIWKTDPDGKVINVPEDIFNHAMDALRYGFESFDINRQELVVHQQQINYPSAMHKLRRGL